MNIHRASKRCVFLPFTAGLAFFCVGCVGIGGGWSDSYFVKRAVDLVDVFSVSLSAGLGITANARMTYLLQAGIGFSPYTYKIGFKGRKGGIWYSGEAEIGIAPIYYGRIYVPGEGTRSLIGNIQILGDGGEDSILGIKIVSPRSGPLLYYPHGDRGRWEVGFTAHCLVGVNAAVDLFELADFILGWFGLDIAKDDKPPPEPEEETIKEP